jgi:hypothetical protein
MDFENVKKIYVVIATENPSRIILDLEKSSVKTPPLSISASSPYLLHRITKKFRAVFIPEMDIDSELYFDFHRQQLAENKICAYCGVISPILEKEHVLPKSLGFHMNKKNKVLSCQECNRQKNNRGLGQWIFEERFNPETSKEKWTKWYQNISTLIERSGKFLNILIVTEWNMYMK